MAPEVEGARGADDVDQLVTAYRYQLRFYLRTWRFVGLAIFTLAVTMVGISIDLYHGSAAAKLANPSVGGFLAGALGNIGFDMAIVTAFFGGDAIAMDLGSGSGYYMLVLPVKRAVLLLGRFLAAFTVTFAVGLFYFLPEFGLAAFFYDTLPTTVLLSLGLGALLAASYLALAFFFSSLFKKPLVSMVVTLLILLLGLPIVDALISALGGFEPWFMIDYAGQVVSNVFQMPPHEIVQHIPVNANQTITIYTFHPYLTTAVATMVGYLVGFVAISWLVYQFREMKG